MNKLFLIIAMVFSVRAEAQTLFIDRIGKYGYKDENGKVIIEPKYSEADSFSEGLAAVREFGSRWGYIDKTGKEVIPLIFSKAAKFSEGLAPVLDRETYKWGFINKKGKFVIKPQYEEAGYFSDGLAKVKIRENTTYVYVNFINKEGETVVWRKYIDARNFSDGLAAVFYDGKWGFIDNGGREVIPLIYNGAWSFSNGMAEVNLNSKSGKVDKTGKEFGDILLAHKLTPFKSDNGKYGFKDETKKVIIEPKYGYAFDFTEDLAAVDFNGKWGFIDNQGKEIVPLKYDDAYKFSDGLARVKLNGKYGFIDKTDKEVIPIKYDWVNNFSDGYTFVTLNGEKLEIDKNNKVSSKDKKLSESFNVIFDNTTMFDNKNYKPQSLSKRLKFEVTRHEIKEYEWQEKNLIWSGSYKLLRTQKIEKSGTHTDTINKLNGLLYLCSDGAIYYFFTKDKINCLRIKQGTTTKDYITPVNRYTDEGNFLFEQKLNNIYNTKESSLSLPEPSGELKGYGNTNTNSNLSLLKQTQELSLYKDSVNNKYGFKGLFGRVAVEPKYDEAAKFADGMARVKLNGKWGYLDATGKEVITPKYEQANDFVNGKAKVTLNGKSFYIDKTGKTIE